MWELWFWLMGNGSMPAIFFFMVLVGVFLHWTIRRERKDRHKKDRHKEEAWRARVRAETIRKQRKEALEKRRLEADPDYVAAMKEINDMLKKEKGQK